MGLWLPSEIFDPAVLLADAVISATEMQALRTPAKTLSHATEADVSKWREASRFVFPLPRVCMGKWHSVPMRLSPKLAHACAVLTVIWPEIGALDAC